MHLPAKVNSLSVQTLMAMKTLRDCAVFPSRQRLFENLRMLPHAPGVQMQAVPEDAIPDDTVDEDTDDPDKRMSSKKHSPLINMPGCCWCNQFQLVKLK